MDLPVGSYGVFEGDVGVSLAGPLGFSAAAVGAAAGSGGGWVAGFRTGAYTGLRYVAWEAGWLDV